MSADPAPTLAHATEAVAAAVKPRLRGWLHAGLAPLVLVAGTALVCLAPTGPARVAGLVFGLSAVLLFGTSAVYHRGTWSPRAAAVLRRMDHSNIFLAIAGTCTPVAVTTLPPARAAVLLSIVWAGALAGVAFRVLWLSAPRWAYVPAYVAVGGVTAAFLPDIVAGGGWAVGALVAGGGLVYVLGAVVYGTRRPDPSPRWFGFHEVFHACTVVGFAAHFVAVALATAAVPAA